MVELGTVDEKGHEVQVDEPPPATLHRQQPIESEPERVSVADYFDSH